MKLTNLVLEDDRVLLSQLELDDYYNLLHFALEEQDLWNYSIQPVAGEDNFRNYISVACLDAEAGSSLPFIVFDKQRQAYAGSTRFYDIQPSAGSLQLGYTWYGKQFQGTGLNVHCKFLMLQYAFEVLNMARVEFRADATNTRSIAAMKKIGCLEEGILRSHSPKATGGRRDTIILSILRKEWFENVKELLKMMQ